MPFNAGLGGEIGHPLEGCEVFGTAVGISRVVDGVDPEPDLLRLADLRKGQRETQKDRVTSRDVGDRDGILGALAG